VADEQGVEQQEQDQGRSARASTQPRPADPRRHAANLLEQAEGLMRLARELRREARRLNASLEAPRPRPDGQSPGAQRSARPESSESGRLSPVRRRRFAPASKPSDGVRAESGRKVAGIEISESGRQPEGMEISDGTRLMVTNMITLGSSREEILTMMRDELGLENADAILALLS
jgi:hypothetical protein